MSEKEKITRERGKKKKGTSGLWNSWAGLRRKKGVSSIYQATGVIGHDRSGALVLHGVSGRDQPVAGLKCLKRDQGKASQIYQEDIEVGGFYTRQKRCVSGPLEESNFGEGYLIMTSMNAGNSISRE